jgi:hypothetical protein
VVTEEQDTVSRTFIHTIDANDLIVFVNEDWLTFARENSAPELSRDAVLGESLWTYVSGLEVRHLYQILLAKVRQSRLSLTVPFRCDSPNLRRLMEMEIVFLPGKHIQMESRLLSLEKREPVALLEESAPRSNECITVCSWCKKVRLPDSIWVEAEQAIRQLRLFEESQLPQLTHGICQDCREVLLKSAHSP